MRKFTRLLVLATSLLLALPAGWCCAAPTPTEPESKSNVPPCCQGRHEDNSRDTSAPITPHQNCECCWAPQSSTPPSKTALPDVPLLVEPLAAVLAPMMRPTVEVPIETGLAFASPPLHVLLCTWVC
jgi:hypothetical protein